MFSCISNLNETAHKALALSELKILLYKRFEDGEDKKKIRRYLRVLSDDSISVDFSKDIVQDIIQKSQLKTFIQNIIPQLDSSAPLNIAQLKQDFNRIVEDTSSSKYELHSLEDCDRRDWSEGSAVPTFSHKLNELLLGGLFPGELGIIQANPGIGKTLTAINMAFAAAINGFVVWFVTLDEMGKDIATRMDLKLARYRGKRAWANRIHIIDFSDGARTADLQILLEQNGTPGLIITDGTDDFIDSNKGDDGERQRLGRVYKSLRRLSRRKSGPVPMWLTTQSTAASETKLKKGMFDMAENKVAKAGEASVIISINQTEEESEHDMARLFLSKARRPCGPGHSVTLKYDRSGQSLSDEDADEEEVMESLKNVRRGKR